MEGIIFFADDNVFDNDFENGLFIALSKEKQHPVLPIVNLSLLETSIKSSSSIKALIVDWNFKKGTGEDGVELPDETPFDILMNAELFSLVYVYSENNIEATEQGTTLKEKFGDKIRFRQKNKSEEQISEEKQLIIADLVAMQEQNTTLSLPIKWTQAINQSVQKIFHELHDADPNWVKEVYTTAEKDGIEPNTEVIGVFNHLLSELLVQNSELKKEIVATSGLADIVVANREESLAKLYHRIYYTKLADDAPIMTGDIFTIDNAKAAILITPECDINKKKDTVLEFLITESNSFKVYLTASYNFTIGTTQLDVNRRKTLFKKFNQEEIKIHTLPSFPFNDGVYNNTALIDFQSSLVRIEQKEFSTYLRKYKINSPYIHQLRQRYLSYIGRVGVPAIPYSLREYNLK